MKTKILDYLRRADGWRTSSVIAADTTEKASSVSKCLTRLARKGEVHFQRQGGTVFYRVPVVANSTPETSASAVANS